MTKTDEVFTSIQQQNEIIISLLARLVWTLEKIVAIVAGGKRNPDAYVTVYNNLDGTKTGKELAAMAGVAHAYDVRNVAVMAGRRHRPERRYQYAEV